jgi:hypothetical protein
MIGEVKRKELLKAMNRKKTEKIDFSLNTENLKRLTEMMNRDSNTYINLGDSAKRIPYEEILKAEGFI